MQISAANLLASQQVRPAQQPANTPATQSAAKTEGDGFEALLFKQAAKPAMAAPTAAAQPAQQYGGTARPGSQVDIRI